MLIPASFKASYEAELAVVESIENIAGARLRQLCNQNHWLFDQRMKDAESVLAKLQLGRISSIRLVADFYAAVVVVPTRLQLEEAVDTVSALFARADVRRERNVDPLSFPYDDVHLIAQMGAGPVVPTVAATRPFEVQIRTGLEYAWWWATHDRVYKGGLPEWAVLRIASEARANLELLDAILADLPGAAKLHPARDLSPGTDLLNAIGLADAWPEPQRPRDLRRFGDTVVALARIANVQLQALIDAVRHEGNRDLVGLPGITPAQACLAVVVRQHGVGILDRFRAEGLSLFVSPEMIERCPELDHIAQDLRVELRPES